jgi:hypothetical protein
MQIGKKKMVLDHVLIDRMASEEDDGKDLESILRHGAKALLDDDESGDVIYTPDSVDKLLDRSQAEQARTPDENASASEFSFARVWANDAGGLEDQLRVAEEDPATSTHTWEKILQERERAAAEEARKKAEILGRGKRKRTAIDYSTTEPDPSPAKPRASREADSDADFNENEDKAASNSDYSRDEAVSNPNPPVKKLEGKFCSLHNQSTV